MSDIPLETNFDHLDMDMEIHVNDYSDNRTEIPIKEWGIRIIEEDYSYLNFTNSLTLDQEALGCQLRLSGEEEVSSYFTHHPSTS